MSDQYVLVGVESSTGHNLPRDFPYLAAYQLQNGDQPSPTGEFPGTPRCEFLLPESMREYPATIRIRSGFSPPQHRHISQVPFTSSGRDTLLTVTIHSRSGTTFSILVRLSTLMEMITHADEKSPPIFLWDEWSPRCARVADEFPTSRPALASFYKVRGTKTVHYNAYDVDSFTLYDINTLSNWVGPAIQSEHLQPEGSDGVQDSLHYHKRLVKFPSHINQSQVEGVLLSEDNIVIVRHSSIINISC